MVIQRVTKCKSIVPDNVKAGCILIRKVTEHLILVTLGATGINNDKALTIQPQGHLEFFHSLRSIKHF